MCPTVSQSGGKENGMVKYKKLCTEKTEDYFVFSASDEYPGAEIEERWIVASDLTEAQLLAKYTQLKKYQPYIALTMEQGFVIYKSNLNEDYLDRLERRHCISLDRADYQGETFGMDDPKILTICGDLEETIAETDLDAIRKAIHFLTSSQKELLFALFVQKMTQKDYALAKGVSKQAVSSQFERIKKILKKFSRSTVDFGPQNDRIVRGLFLPDLENRILIR